MAEPRPGVWYTQAQMAQMRKEHPDFVMHGHVLRLEVRGGKPMFKFVHWSQASGGGHTAEDGTLLAPRAYAIKSDEDDLEPLTPIKKRTPQERVDSLQSKLDARQLTDQQVADIVGRSWKRGQPVTAETVRAFAAGLLQDAERKAD